MVSFQKFTDDMQAMDWDGSVFIAAGYGLDSPGIKSRWARYSTHLSTLALGSIHPAFWKWGCWFLFPRQIGRGLELTIHPHVMLWLKEE